MTNSERFTVRDQREPGWFFVDNELVDKYGNGLGAYGLAVYAVICRHCKTPAQQVDISQRDIAATLGISQDRVRKSLTDLVESGLIHVEVPERPSPGIISTIILLKVKATERQTFSSIGELNATRSRNKEVKTKTETETPPPLISTLFEESLTSKENARARETYGQKDFYERDLRELGRAFREINRSLGARVGSSQLSEKQIFEWACELAGISVGRGLEVQRLGREWPAETETSAGQQTAS
jgi:hypothetical protein